MIEPGPTFLLAYPAFSFALCLAALAGAVFLLLREAGKRSVSGQAAYWQALHLASEVLLAIGLIGLVVFGGRLALTTSAVAQEQRVRAASALGAERAEHIVATYCPAAQRALAPYNPGVAASELCAIASQHGARSASTGGLQVTAAALRDFDQRYPGCVDNVFSRNNDCERTVAAARDYGAAVEATVQAIRAQRQSGSQLLAVHGSSDSGFALAAAFLAALGMAIRIARAAQPYWPARFSGRR